MKRIILLSVICYTLAVPLQEDDPVQEFVDGNHKFSSTVYKEVAKQTSGNFIASPLSAEVILALTNEGAKGDTSKELMEGLSLPSTKERTQEALKSFLPSLKRSEDELKLLSANKIYAANDLKLVDDFRSIATDIYNADIDNVDFSKNVETSAAINKWVEDHTNGKIKDLIDSGSIDGDTKIVLVNAIYFSGKWSAKFEKRDTTKKTFFTTKDKFVDTDTMHQTNQFNYYEHPTLDAKFLELPYKGDNISMFIVLPNEKDGLDNLERNIDQVLASQPLSWERVDVDLPKFTIETKIEFIPILQELGISKLFSQEGDLSGISSNYGDAAVSDVIQKAYIKVGESGTEAAAATAVVRKLGISSAAISSLAETYEFHADHPFLYFIKLKGTVLFTGRYTNPAV